MKNKNTKTRKLTKKEKFIIFKLKILDAWDNNYFRKKYLIFLAYLRLLLAMLFVKDVSSKLLRIDIIAMVAMNSKQKKKYENILRKVVERISFPEEPNYSIQEFILETSNSRNLNEYKGIWVIFVPALILGIIDSIFKLPTFTFILSITLVVLIHYTLVLIAKDDHKKQQIKKENSNLE